MMSKSPIRWVVCCKHGMSKSEKDQHTEAEVGDRSRFSRVGIAAHGKSAAHARREFGTWLHRHLPLSDERHHDVVLAVNEALANAAEFAYIDRHDGAPNGVAEATMDVQATYDVTADTLTVEVTDRGCWHGPEPSTGTPPPNSLRGRGIALMHALSDHTTIAPTSTGTQVTMQWSRVLRADTQHAGAQAT